MQCHAHVIQVLMRLKRRKSDLISWKYRRTSMHSGRMRTARLLTVCLRGEGGLPLGRGEASSSLPGGLPTVYMGSAFPQCHGAGRLPVNRMTHICENITLPHTSYAGGNEV